MLPGTAAQVGTDVIRGVLPSTGTWLSLGVPVRIGFAKAVERQTIGVAPNMEGNENLSPRLVGVAFLVS